MDYVLYKEALEMVEEKLHVKRLSETCCRARKESVQAHWSILPDVVKLLSDIPQDSQLNSEMRAKAGSLFASIHCFHFIFTLSFMTLLEKSNALIISLQAEDLDTATSSQLICHIAVSEPDD